MAWSFKSVGNGLVVASETVTLGGTDESKRYTSVINFIPPGRDFVILSNAAKTNTSVSCHDEMYVCDTSSGTFVQAKSKMRSTGQGTSYDTLDNTTRARRWDVSADGEWPYYKLVCHQSGVESTGKTIKFVVIYNGSAKAGDTY